MTIFPPKDVATRIGLKSGGLLVLESNVIWARRDRFAYCIEAMIDTEVAYQTAHGWVITRRKTLVSTPINRIGGTRARLTRAAALLTAALSAPSPAPQADTLPLAA